MEFDIVEAALSGLKLFRRKPGVYGWWVLFNLLFTAAILGVLYLLFAGWVQQILNLAVNKQEPTPAVILSIFPRFGLSLLVLAPLGVVFSAVRIGAATRAMLEPDNDRFGYLRLGVDEMRLMLVNLVLFLIRFAVQAIFSVLLLIMVGVTASNRHMADNISGMLAAQMAQQLLTLPLYAAQIFLFIKFALAFPMTLDMRKIEIFGSWTMTNNRFWPMLLTYVLAGVIWLAVGLVAGLLGVMAVLGMGGAMFASLGSTLQSNPADVARQVLTFLPALIAGIAVLSALFSPIVTALIYCPGPTIYRAINGRTEDVF